MNKFRAFIDEGKCHDGNLYRTHTREFNTFEEANKWLETLENEFNNNPHKFYTNSRIIKNNEH